MLHAYKTVAKWMHYLKCIVPGLYIRYVYPLAVNVVVVNVLAACGSKESLALKHNKKKLLKFTFANAHLKCTY